MMKALFVVALLIASVIALDVKIDSLFKPDDCAIRAKPGDTVRVHYTGKLIDQTVFDSSLQAGREPIEFQLGAGRVIPGWERGISGMCIGEKRLLTIPPELGYGNEAVGPIPAGSTLIFETELVGIPVVGPELAQQEAPATTTGSFSTSQFGVFAIVGAFVVLVIYMVKSQDSGSKRSGSSRTQEKRERRRK